MTQANELRTGNWIKSETELFGKKDWHEWQVTIEDFEHIKNNPENYFGIPLTEEWLLKFGFYCDLGDYKLKDFQFNIYKPITSKPFILADGQVHIKENIIYVHELQNLYFALTKKELIL